MPSIPEEIGKENLKHVDFGEASKISLEHNIKTMTAFLKKATGILKNSEYASEEDLKYFDEHRKWLMAGRALADTNEKLAIVLLQYSSLVNKLFFLLIRKDLEWESLLEDYRGLETIELIQLWVKDFSKAREAKQGYVKALVSELKEDEDELDIFKAVCNGMSEEDAKKQLAQYDAQLQKAMGGNAE